MATTDTTVKNLTVNKLTYSQWKTEKTNNRLSDTEVYELTDVNTALQEKLTEGTGIDITNNTISNSGVRGVSTGTNNGTISVNTNGTSAEVSVAGLGSSAFVDTTNSVTSAETKTLTSGGAYTNLVRRLSSSAATGSVSQGIYVDANGQVQTCDAVTSTYSGTGTAPVNGTAVKSAIDAAIASVYKPAGSVAFANLPSPVKALNGNVYDVTDAFTTDSKFVNSGESYPAGTNVVVINTSGSTYKYDVLPGFIDLTPYQKTETAVTHTKNTAAGDSKTPVYVASDGTATALSYTIETSVPSGAVFTDTKNTAGSTDTSSKIYLVGATSQAANPQTYSQDTAFVDANGRLNSAAPASDANDTTVATTKWVKDQSYVPTTRTINSKALSSNITLSASDVSALPDSTIIPTITDTYNATSSDGMSGKAVASAISGKQDSSTAVTHTVSTAVGSATNPVYIASDGTATATTYTLSKSVPSDAVFTDTTYSDFTGATSGAAGTSGLVPAPAVVDRAKFLAGDGTWATPTGTTYSDMTGATESAAGTHGLAPAPAVGDNTKFLRGDATWATIDALPSQTSQSGKFLTTNGTTASWATVDALPSQTSQSGKFLTTNGSTASWASLPIVDQTYSGTSTNAQSGVAVKSAIDSAISSVYKAAGSIAFTSRPTPGASYEGNVYNITDAFTTDSTFVEGSGKSYPAGTNIVCINTSGTTYKWDVLAGFVDLSDYQPLLVSGTNIKTVNGTSVLGSGNISVDSLPTQTGQSGKFLTTNGTTASWGDTVTATESSLKTIEGNSILGTGDIAILPSQTSQSGKFLTTDGSAVSWANVDALPSQTGQSGKFLTTNGSAASWASAPAPATDSSTINTNSNSQLQAIGVIEKNAGTVKYDWVGTLAQWTAGRSGGTIPDSWICYITDDETTSVSVDWSSLVNVPTYITALGTSGGNVDAGTM